MTETTDAAGSTDPALAVAEVEAQMVELAGHIRASIRDSAASIDPRLQPFGLTVLRVLARLGPTHAGVVAESLAVDRSVISRQAKLLCALGFIETRTDPLDGRARILALTPLGAQKIAETRRTAFVHRRLNRWSDSDLAQLATLLRRLNEPD